MANRNGFESEGLGGEQRMASSILERPVVGELCVDEGDAEALGVQQLGQVQHWVHLACRRVGKDRCMGPGDRCT